MKPRTCPGQSELDFFAVPAAPRSDSGGLDISLAVRETLTDLLGAATLQGHDRHEIAARISRLSNHEISKHMLDRYTAPSADAWRFPLEALPAITQASGDYRLLELVAEACGCKLYRGEEAMLAEIGALTLQERNVKARLVDLRKNVPDAVMERLVGEVLKRLGSK
ncbi:MAG: hypothetical protein Q8K43_10515 [Sulfurimicrobium sp.]|nr:hypothetical protein [Gallionella sp.]MDP1898308.1 hypothetical protein [Sulfurimicrobium sp.]